MHPHRWRAFERLQIASGICSQRTAASGPGSPPRLETESPGFPRTRDDVRWRLPDVRQQMWSLSLVEQMQQSCALKQVSRPLAKPAQKERLALVSRGLKNFKQDGQPGRVDI